MVIIEVIAGRLKCEKSDSIHESIKEVYRNTGNKNSNWNTKMWEVIYIETY